MAIEWKEDLAVGVKEVDEQHKELFSKINELFEACSASKGKEYINDIISYLENYVVFHFSSEEKLQKENNYPEYENHKLLHEKFVKDFLALKEKIEKDGVTGLTIVQLNQLLVDWLVKHIRKMDKALGLFLKEKGITE